MRLNVIVLIGRLGKDPEHKTTSGGKDVTRFSIAVNKRSADAQPDWFDIVCWNKLATWAGDGLHKGDMVTVTGRMESRKYESQAGPRIAWEVIADDVQRFYTEPRKVEGKPDPDEYDPFAEE